MDGMGSVFRPGRSADLSSRIEIVYMAEPTAIYSVPAMAKTTGEPVSMVAYAFTRLKQAGKVEELDPVEGSGSTERTYRAVRGAIGS